MARNFGLSFHKIEGNFLPSRHLPAAPTGEPSPARLLSSSDAQRSNTVGMFAVAFGLVVSCLFLLFVSIAQLFL